MATTPTMANSCFLCIVKPPTLKSGDNDTVPLQNSSQIENEEVKSKLLSDSDDCCTIVLLQSVLFQDRHNNIIPAHIQAQTQQLTQFMHYCKRCKKRLNLIRTQIEQLRQLEEALGKQKQNVRSKFLEAVRADMDNNNAELVKLQQLRQLIVTTVTDTELGGQQTKINPTTVPLDGVRIKTEPVDPEEAAASTTAEFEVEGQAEIPRPWPTNVKIKTEPVSESEAEEAGNDSCKAGATATWKSFEEIGKSERTELGHRRRGHGQRPLDGQDAEIPSSADPDRGPDSEPRKKQRKKSSKAVQNGSGSESGVVAPTETGSDNNDIKPLIGFGAGSDISASTDTTENKKPSGRRKSVKPFLCSICSKGFLHADSLQIHVYNSHADSNPPRIPCLFCPLRFAKKKTHDLHAVIHEGEKPFECKICANRFALRKELFDHVNGDHGRPMFFSCSTCSKGFSRVGNLRNHEINHRHGIHASLAQPRPPLLWNWTAPVSVRDKVKVEPAPPGL